MKKVLLVAATLLVSNMAFADMDCRWGIDHRHPRCGPRFEPRTVIVERNDWVAPLIIGGIAGAVIANANQQQQQPVVVQQPQTVIVQTQTVCTAWKEIQQPDGQIYRERTCTK
jgi:hypothetical protein